MCLIALAWRVHPRYQLALVANRDELHARPAAPASFDPEATDVYGGRDLVQGGGWLQVSTRGRLAAVTNVRVGLAPGQAPRSRGWLVRDFVRSGSAALAAATALGVSASEYGRFNLLLHDGECLVVATNYPGPAHSAIEPGMHAMSNGAFDAPWPKSAHATRALDAWLHSRAAEAAAVGMPEISPLFDALADSTPAPDATLPDTGVGLDLERALSPAFVLDERYGTRCSTVVLVERDALLFAERRFAPSGVLLDESLIHFPMARR
ncbi:NRDE family protein [Luteimonas vadosa]